MKYLMSMPVICTIFALLSLGLDANDYTHPGGGIKKIFSAKVRSTPEYEYIKSKKIIENNNILYVIEADINGDGEFDKLISNSGHISAYAGNNWCVYLKNDGVYIKTLESLVFSMSQFYVGWIEEVDGYGLVSLYPTGLDRARVMAGYFKIDGTSLEFREKAFLGDMVLQGLLPMPQGDHKLIKKYFSGNAGAHLKSINVFMKDDLLGLVEEANKKMTSKD